MGYEFNAQLLLSAGTAAKILVLVIPCQRPAVTDCSHETDHLKQAQCAPGDPEDANAVKSDDSGFREEQWGHFLGK